MKLLLTSFLVPDQQKLVDLVGKEKSATKLAMIPNAKDYYAKTAWEFKTSNYTSFFTSIGYDPALIDLRDYDDPAKLESKLSEFDLIWVMGGNTFNLRYEMSRSGFDQIIDGLLSRGVVYAGDSAGAVVAGKTLKGTEAADEPSFAPNIIWEGLNLLPNIIVPHTDNPQYINSTEAIRQMHKSDDSLIELKDSEFVVVDGSSVQKF